MGIDEIKLVVDLTKAKVDILKLKADDYNWHCHIDEGTREQLLELLQDIDYQLLEIKGEKDLV